MPPVNEDDLEWNEVEHGSTHFKRKKLGHAAALDGLGASLYELPPGGSSWPYHFHMGNTEAIYVLSGSGVLRTPDGEERIEPGEFCGFPPDPDGAHRLRNDGDEPLRYLAVSTMQDPDVTVYPDSEKFGVFAGSAPGDDGERVVSGFFRPDDDISYWDDEP